MGGDVVCVEGCDGGKWWYDVEDEVCFFMGLEGVDDEEEEGWCKEEVGLRGCFGSEECVDY